MLSLSAGSGKLLTSWIIIVIAFLWLSSEIFLARTRRSQPTDARLDRSSTRALWLTILPSVAIGVLLGIERVGEWEAGSRSLPIAGLSLIVGGLILRWVAIVSLKQHFTVDVSIRADHQIVDNGIYRFIRHPSYSGSLLSFLGLGLSFSNFLSVVIIFVPICVAFLYRIHLEEEALLQAFGSEYREYCQSTRRLLPGIF
jgi:protein-S-isoprenylcysteine O-methyltransferase Ste14